MGARTKKFPLKISAGERETIVLRTRSPFFSPLILLTTDNPINLSINRRKLPRSFRRCNTTSWWFRRRTVEYRRSPRQSPSTATWSTWTTTRPSSRPGHTRWISWRIRRSAPQSYLWPPRTSTQEITGG